MLNLITGLIGIAMVTIYLGFLLLWIKAVPLIVICVIVLGFIVYDFVKTLRTGERLR